MKCLKLLAALLALALLFLYGVRFYQRASPAKGASRNLPSGATGNSASAAPARSSFRTNHESVPAKANVADAPSLKGFPALAEFSDWAKRFASGENVDLAAGERLALNRRNVMLHLIKTDPEQALAQTVPARWRLELPREITQHFEERVDARGSLDVLVGTDFEHNRIQVSREVTIGDQRYAAYVYGWRLSQMSQSSLPIHGIAIDNHLAMLPNPLRKLEPEEVEAAGLKASEEICGVSGNTADSRRQPVAADTGGRIRYFCGADHYKLVNDQWLAAEGGPGGEGGQLLRDTWNQGTKNLLYMRVNFPDDLSEPISEANAYNVMSGVNSYYVEGSYNTTALITTVTPLLTLPQTKSYYSSAGAGALMSDARQLARDAGYETANYDRDIVTHTSVPGFDWGGLASVGGKGVWLQSTGVGVTSHELGHNEGLWHANWWDTTDNSGIIGTGAHVEYGNVYDTMGAASAGANQFNAMHKWRIDWLPEGYIHNVTSNGVYRLFAFDVPNRTAGHFFAARFRKDWQRDYWIEFRQRFPSNPWLVHGVMVNWDPWLESSGGTHLLDTTPGTPTAQSGREDAAVVIGRTFSDTVSGVHITPVARGGAGVNSWIDVNVSLGSFPSNHPPTLQVSADRTNAPVGTRINFRATATDPDADTLAYHWDFGDLTFSTNNAATAFKTWSANGEHVVRCIVSDMKGGSASANLVVRVGTPPADLYRVSGRITDTNGVPIEGARVDNGETDGNDYLGAYTDRQGNYTIVGVTNGTSFSAVKYRYTFSPNVTTVNLPPDLETNDFIATPLTTVNIAASTNTVSEPNGLADFVLTRIGDTNLDLNVALYRSGTATISSDYTLSPLQGGANYHVVTIPAGSNSVILPLQVLDDGSSEGPETVTLTLVEDINVVDYIVVALGEATMTILDNDAVTLPSVSVSATTSSGDNSSPENGYDSGRFIFTRTGSVANDLTVNYSASGTATAGVDYQALLGVVIIPAGQSSASAEFQTIDDTQVETNETVIVVVSPSPAYSVSGGNTTVRIIDDDLLTVTITPTSSGAAEPTATGRFTITRAGDLVPNLVVNYTVSGVATGGVDYAAMSGTVTIPAGAITANITLTPIDDSLVEGDESVIVSLTANAGYNVGSPGSATLFIRDNERPTVSLSAPDGTASEPGSETGMLRISRGTVTSGNLTVELAITGSALSGEDYIPLDKFVTIPDGSSSVDRVVTAFNDSHKEDTESVIITLVSNSNYTFSSGARASVDIEDDDPSGVPAVGFALTASSAPESRYGGVVVSLSVTSTSPITVDYQIVAGGTAGNGTDYTLPAGTLTFDPGDLAKTLPLTVINDTAVESNETVKIVLVNPIGASHDGNKFYTYTILDDDSSTVSLTVTAMTALEAGAVPGNFRISRTGGTSNSQPVVLDITGTASAPSDYQTISKVITIPVGAGFVDVPVAPADDTTVEIAETVNLTLTSAPGAKLGSSTEATVTILDNDVDNLPIISVVSSNNIAGEPGADAGEFMISRSGATNPALTVFFTLTGTASNGLDYAFITNAVTIPAGQTSAIVTLTVIDDLLVEGEETAIFDLTVRDTYRVGAPAEATLTILDNEQRVRVEVSDAFAAEPGTDTGEFTFTRFGTTNGAVTVFFTVTGTAGNGVDYVIITNAITIPDGGTEAKLQVIPLDERLIEPTETVIVTLFANAAYFVGTPTSATVMLFDNEPTLTLVGNTNASENGEQPGVLTINRGGDPTINLEIHLSIGGTATFGVDYPAFRTNICMPVGVMTTVITFYPTNELRLEGNETVFAALVPDPDYTILSPGNTTVTIADVTTNHFPVAQITSPTTKTIYAAGSTNLNLILEATATDPDDTNAVLTFAWEQVSGPGTMFFSDPATNNTTVSFTNAGVYLLRVAADDGQLRGFDYVTVVVDSINLLTPDLLHWKFDDGSGTAALDSSGAGRNGSVSGASWITNGAVDGALSFDGVSNLVQEISGTNFLDGLNALTVTLWVRTSATNAELGVFSANGSGGTNTTLAFGQVEFNSCLGVSNLLQVTLPTTGGDLRYVSPHRFASNQWQHVALSWTNGGPLAFYLNGEPETPVANSLGVEGVLTNCPQFLVGLTSPTNHWNGAVDDVRLFARALDAGEVKALLSLPPTNFVPLMDAGADLTVQLINPVNLAGEAADDGLPNPPALMTNVWTFVSGPGVATILDPTNFLTGVTFTSAGSNVFRLIADDSTAKVFDDVIVTVTEPTIVDIFVADFDAAELGPDEAQFMLTRSGDTNFDIAVQLFISGTASNGADYVTITNVIMLPADANSVLVTIRPFLDNRTEGDETVTLEILPDLAYTSANPSATIMIHDSPFGVWTVDHFTLEELTDPTLSGEGADFDHDGLVNFVEYAFDRDPKVGETNSPMTVTIELNPADGQNHITLTYQRRIQPVDVNYAVYISNDLLAWNTGPTYVEEIQVTPDPNGFTETVKARIKAPYTLTTNQFLTIRVWRPQQ